MLVGGILALLPRWGVAQTVRFPDCEWSGVSVIRDVQHGISVKAGDGRQLIRLIPGEGMSPSKIHVDPRADCIEIDAREAFAENPNGKVSLYCAAYDPAAVTNGYAMIRTVAEAGVGTRLTCYLEGNLRTASGSVSHFSNCSTFRMKGAKEILDYAFYGCRDFIELWFRWDLSAQTGAPFRLYSAAAGSLTDLNPPPQPLRQHEPKLIFHAGYEDCADADLSGGDGVARVAKGLEYVRGVRGKGVRMMGANGAVLRYAIPGNVVPERGTVAMWVKRQWGKRSFDFRSLFAFPKPKGERNGSGQLWFFFYGWTLRGDLGDDNDTNTMFFSPGEGRFPYDEDWHLIAFRWDEGGVRISVDGKPIRRGTWVMSPIAEAFRTPDRLSFHREPFTEFCVGNCSGGEQCDSVIDELRIWSAPVEDKVLADIWTHERPDIPSTRKVPDWRMIWKDASPNAYEADAGAAQSPGIPRMELVEEIRLDAETVKRLRRENRYVSTGAERFGSLGDRGYMIVGEKEHDRFALRFNIDTNAPLYCFEIDYPDDGLRTADIIVQMCKGSVWDGQDCADYPLQVGYAAGGEYPNTNRMLTHRCLYWSRSPDIALSVMTCRDGEPAALAAIRLCRVKGGRLPDAGVREPPKSNGWGRSVALYYEDPAIENDFARSWNTAEGFAEVIDRTAATMKFTGENLFIYPGAWYGGRIGSDEGYDARHHPDDFLAGFYTRFDREGLSVMPAINTHHLRVVDGLLRRSSLGNGVLHDSPVAAQSDGLFGTERTHNTPAGFNFTHPEVQAYLTETVDAFIEQGLSHPSFKGICLHLTRYNMLWFGDERSGYNDYTVDQFCRDRGLTLPANIDRKEPKRSKAYYEWLRREHWDAWLDWRCDKVTAFWGAVARKMASRRPDLKLMINSFAPPDPDRPSFLRPDLMRWINRGGGLDGRKLTAASDNIILCQSLVPADSRWGSWGYPHKFAKPEYYERQCTLGGDPRYWDLLEGASYPWLNLHDRYFEDAIGGSSPLKADWLQECPWRVTTINSSGRNALRHFAEPLRFGDVLGLSKGGYLIGTYGMEDVLVPFVRAFRALPPVKMRDDPASDVNVKIRRAQYAGRDYFYVLNTDKVSHVKEIPVPVGTEDLAGGRLPEKFFGRTMELKLKPYELRSFSAPIQKPDERVVLVGDSITHMGLYAAYLQLLHNLKRPGESCDFLNAGISGECAAHANRRFDWDVAPRGGDRAFIMFGMNDVGLTDYANVTNPSPEMVRARKRSLENYGKEMVKLLGKCNEAGLRQVLITPSPYDQYSSRKVGGGQVFQGNEPGLSECAEIVRALGRERGIPVIDLHGEMTALLKAYPDRMLCSADRTHPGEEGALLMASIMAESLGWTNVLDESVVDAKGGTSLDFTVTPKTLPFPNVPEARKLQEVRPFRERFDRRTLRIRNLPNGIYSIRSEGGRTMTFSSDELSSGVDLRDFDMAGDERARKAHETVMKMRRRIVALRDVASVRAMGVLQKYGGDFRDDRATMAAADAWIAELETGNSTLRTYYLGVAGNFKRTYTRILEVESELAALHDSLRELTVPIAIRFHLRSLRGKSQARKSVNIVNFVRGCAMPAERLENHLKSLASETALIGRYGFPSTVLFQYDALIDRRFVDIVRRLDPGRTEYGLWLEVPRQLAEDSGLTWKGAAGVSWDWHVNVGFPMGFPPEDRLKLVDTAFNRFRKEFGTYPKVVGAWLQDSRSMSYMVSRYGVDGFCICREQDNTDAYGLRGGYSNGIYYPSKRNMLSAAVDMENALATPVVRMLTPDPIYNYALPEKRYADYPIRHGCPTLEPCWEGGQREDVIGWFFRTYFASPGLSGLSYMQIGQENSFGRDKIMAGLPLQFETLDRYVRSGIVALETLGETCRKFKADNSRNVAQTQVALNDWSGGDRKSIWYNCANYRANLLFDKGKVCFRDIHKMADDFDEPHLDSACTTWDAHYFTPPVVDECLSRTNGVSGVMEFNGEFAALAADATGPEELSVTCARRDGTKATVRFSGQGIDVAGADLTWQFSCGNGAPFSVNCEKDAIYCCFLGYRYRIGLDAVVWKTGQGVTLAPRSGRIRISLGN